jgi:hypothetical protein
LRNTPKYVCAEVRGAQLRNAAFKILARALSSLKLLNSATLALFHDQESGCNERLQLLLLLERCLYERAT